MLPYFPRVTFFYLFRNPEQYYLKKENIDGVDSILSGQPYLLRDEAQDCIIKHNTAPRIAALQNLFSFFIF
jgi:hypothetical protein